MSIPPLLVELNSVEIIQVINKVKEDLSKLINIVGEVVDVAVEANMASFSHCMRSKNVVVYTLARGVVGLSNSFV